MADSTQTNGFAERILRNLNKVATMVNDEAIPIMQKEIQDTYDNVIDEYYEEYSADYRSSNDGMRNMLTFGSDQDGPYAYIDPEKMEYDRSRDATISMTPGAGVYDESGFKEYLYGIAFVSGYHGGADKIAQKKAQRYGAHPEPGTPYYRAGQYYQEWGRESYKSTESPLEKLQKRTEELKQTKFKKLAQDLFSKYAHHLRDI